MADAFERVPYAAKNISLITDKDVSVKVLGRIVKKDKESSSIVLDDGDKAVIVLLPRDELFNKAEVGKQVRVLGTVLPFEGGFELKADVMQDFEGVDKDLYTRIYSKILWPQGRQ